MQGWCVYVLRSQRNGRLYTGSTNDIGRRIREHRAVRSAYTRNVGPFDLVYTEACGDGPSARRRERWYKSGQGREELHRVLESRGVDVVASPADPGT